MVAGPTTFVLKQILFLVLFFIAFLIVLRITSPVHAIPLQPISRQTTPACTFSVDGARSRKVLQMDGFADDVIKFYVCPPSGFDIVSYQVSTSSSSKEVLPASNIELSSAFAPPCVNGTASLDFDAMVGTVDFFLSATLSSAGLDSTCSTSLDYIVAGLTIFETRVANTSTEDSVFFTKSIQNINFNNYSTPSTRTSVVASDGDPSIEFVIRSSSSNAFSINFRDAESNPVRTYDVRVQYPDGSTSSSKLPDQLFSSINNLSAQIPKIDESSPIRFNTTDCQSVVVTAQIDVALSSDDDECGIALALRGIALAFGLRLQRFKDGAINLSITWPDFTGEEVDNELSGEEFYNMFYMNVVGDPPPVVVKLSSPQSLYRSGGQVVKVLFDNVNNSSSRVLKVGNTSFSEVQGSFRRLENGLYEAEFITAPGNGTSLPWVLEVSYENVDDGNNSTNATAPNLAIINVPTVFSYISSPIAIESLFPPWGNDSAVVTLQGYFDGFDPSKEGHDIYIGDKTAAELGITPIVDNEAGLIFLPVPLRSIAGSAYEYPIRVNMNDEATEASTFVYVPEILDIDIAVIGGSYINDMGEYELGICEFARYIAVLPQGIGEPVYYEWSLLTRINGTVVNLLQSYDSSSPLDKNAISLQARVFRGRSGIFVLSVTCLLYGQVVSKSVTLRKLGVPIIGVSLPILQKRTLAIPDIPVRVSATVTLPDENCFRIEAAVIYEWRLNNESFFFSPWNMTLGDLDTAYDSDNIDLNDDVVRITRIGRELVIPQSKLTYGNLTIFLRVSINDTSTVSGNSTTVLEVFKPVFVPTIGIGAESMVHNASQDLILTALRSRNPDDIYLSNETAIDDYNWGCFMSLENMTSSGDNQGSNDQSRQFCPPDLLPSDGALFHVVPTTALQSARDLFQLKNNQSEPIYLQFSLSVGNGLIFSQFAFLTVKVIGGDLKNRLGTIDDVSVFNGRGTWIDRRRVRFYDDIIIAPTGVNITWSFSILSPRINPNLFNSTSNLIISESYYNPETEVPQALPLGIRAGTLRPARSYYIQIHTRPSELLANGGESSLNNTVILLLRTVDTPKLILPPLSLTSGDFQTVFSASARTNLDSPETFYFFFFAITSGGDEICIDGCNGQSIVQFRLLESGTFRILVRLKDVQGTSVLDEQKYDANITIFTDSVTNNSTINSSTNSFSRLYYGSFETYQTTLRTYYAYGDHAMVQMLSSTLARQIKRLELEIKISDIDGLNALSASVKFMHDIILNSVPSGLTARSYLQTINLLARLSPKLLTSTDILESLFSMVDAAISTVPLSEALDLQEEVLTFYNYSTLHVVKPFAVVYFGLVVPVRVLKLRCQRQNQIGYNGIIINNNHCDGTGGIISTLARQGQSDLVENIANPPSVLITFFEWMQKLLSLVVSRDAVCGSSISINTSVKNGIPGDSLLDRVNNESSTEKILDDQLALYGSFVSSFQEYQIPLVTTFSLVALCNQSSEEIPTVKGAFSHASVCNETLDWWRDVDSPEATPEAETPEENLEMGNSNFVTLAGNINEVNAIQRQDVELANASIVETSLLQQSSTVKRVFVLMETMDYGWVSGLLENAVKTSTTVLTTTNLTDINGRSIRTVFLSESFCHVINTTVPKLGLTENRGCISGNGFVETKTTDIQEDAATKTRDWNLIRRFGFLRSIPSVDGSSTTKTFASRTGIFGVKLSNCPKDTKLPSVALPDTEDQFPYMAVGVGVAVSATITITWTGTSAYYAAFTGSGILT